MRSRGRSRSLRRRRRHFKLSSLGLPSARKKYSREVRLSQKSGDITVVGEGGLEPPHPFEYRHLKPARLPISPLALSPRHNSPRGERWIERPRNDCRDRYSKGCHGFEKS